MTMHGSSNPDLARSSLPQRFAYEQEDLPAPARAPRGRGSPVGWKTTETFRERRARIRAFGATIFATRGLDGARLSDAARHAGIPPGSIGYYYPRRQELIYDIVYSHMLALQEAVGIAEEANPGADPMTRLELMTLAYLDHLKVAADEQKVALAATNILPEAQREELKHQAKLLAFRFGEAVAAAVPALAFGHPLREPVVQSMIAALNHSVLWLGPDDGERRAATARLIARQAVVAAREMLA